MNYHLIYINFAYEVFEYLKNTILCDFPSMQLEISHESNDQLGGNTFNRIKFYINGLDPMYITNITYNKNIILYTLIHEAFHQVQFLDRNKYVYNPNYAKFVECNTDYTTSLFINEHNKELQVRFNMIVYEYNVKNVLDVYNQRAAVEINRNDIDLKYFNSLINRFIDIPSSEVYNIFLKYGTIVIRFVLNDEKSFDQYTIRDDYVLDFDKMNTIMKKYMYNGFEQRLYAADTIEYKDKYLISIYMNNDRIEYMKRLK